MDACLAYGALISVIVSILKRVPWIGAHPKWVAALFAGVAAFLTASPLPGGSSLWATVANVLPCIGAIFASSVAFHEVVTHTAAGDRARD